MFAKLVVVAALMTPSVALAGVSEVARARDFRNRWEAANHQYKLALQATSLGKREEGATSLAAFRKLWSEFVDRYSTRPPGRYASDVRWKPGLSLVAGWAAQTDKLLSSNQLHGAHEALERIRLKWAEVRERNGDAWFGDYLTRFHEPMEVVAVIVKGKSGATLTENQISRISRTLPSLASLWSRVDAAFQSNPNIRKNDFARLQIREVGSAIAGLRKAVREGDRYAMVREGARLKPAFARLYMRFG